MSLKFWGETSSLITYLIFCSADLVETTGNFVFAISDFIYIYYSIRVMEWLYYYRSPDYTREIIPCKSPSVSSKPNRLEKLMLSCKSS